MRKRRGLIALWWRRWRQSRCLHAWTHDPPGWKCMWCDTPAPPGAFKGTSYPGEGQA